jgi:uncharacterized protein
MVNWQWSMVNRFDTHQPMTLTPIPFTRLAFKDAFWSHRIQVNRESTLPTIYKQLQQTGRLQAWYGAWKKGDPRQPHVFWDSDTAKWMEGAAYSLALHPDKKLERTVDRMIDQLGRLQRRDGYLNSHYVQVEMHNRWTNLRDKHELYCAGHLIEAAVAYFEVTGKRRFLDIMCRYADHIDATFGPEPGKQRGYCGHQEIELALVRLYQITSEARYLKLAQYFIEERGRGKAAWDAKVAGRGRYAHYYDLEARERGEDPSKFWAKTYEYLQAHAPVREQAEVVGHAVRAVYMYSGMADLDRLGANSGEPFLPTLERLWTHVTSKRMYVTGGIGPSASNEGFTSDYDLPDETAYAETCAGIGLVFWAHRMLQLTGDAKYTDVLERALYNNVLAGVAADGTLFNYVNPLASRGAHHRKTFFDCACCPPNVVRLVASVGNYFYSTSDDGVWAHLYAQSDVSIEAFGLTIEQRTGYPWDGEIAMKLRLRAPVAFTLRLRIPEWCENSFVRINGGAVAADEATFEKGYVHIRREWRNGDMVMLNLDMPAQLVSANPAVPQALGRAALQRGPLIYCLEQADNGDQLDQVLITRDAEWRTGKLPTGGVSLRTTALRASGAGWDEQLYRSAQPEYKKAVITAVPYCDWDNRGQGEMRVWLRCV